MPYYIQRRDETYVVVTIEEHTDLREAHKAAKEYNVKNPTAYHYVAKRACKAWQKD